MTNDEKEIRRIRFDDLSESLQNEIESAIRTDNPFYKKILEYIAQFTDDSSKALNTEYINLKILPTSHQTINVSIENSLYTSNPTDTVSATILKGSNYVASLIPDQNYTAGKLSINNTGTFDSDCMVEASPAEFSSLTFIINESANQDIAVWYGNLKIDNTQTVNYVKGCDKFFVQVIPEHLRNAGDPIVQGANLISSKDIVRDSDNSILKKADYSFDPSNTSGTFTISAKPVGEIKMCKVSIVFTSHQKIVVRCNGVKHTESQFEVPYGSVIKASVIADDGYYPGTLNYTELVVKEDVTIKATDAITANYLIIIEKTSNQIIRVKTDQGVYETGSFHAPYGTNYSIEVIPKMWFEAGTLNVPKTGKITQNMTIKAGPAYRKTDYDVNVLIDTVDGSKYGADITESFKQKFGRQMGRFDPNYVIDIFDVTDHSSYFAFYGGDNVYGLFKTFSAYFETPVGQKFTIAENIPNDRFNDVGDLDNLRSIINHYELLKALKEQWIKVHIHIDI